MHNEDSGVWIYLIDAIEPYLLAKHPSSLVKDKLRYIHQYMAAMPRAIDYNLPLCDGEYVPKHSRVQAKEHRNAMQAMPFILHGINEPELCELFAV